MELQLNNLNKAKNLFDGLDVSELTRKDYKYRIGAFLAFVSSRGFHSNSFLEYKRHLGQDSDLKVASKNKYLATARIFLKELYRGDILPKDITTNVKSFAQNKKHKKAGLSDEDMSKLKAYIKELPDTNDGARFKALFFLLAFQGLRQIEIIRIHVEDLDLVAGTAAIKGKGQDDTENIYLHPLTAKALKKHITVNKVRSGAVFKPLACQCKNACNHKGEGINTMTIKRIFGTAFDKLGIDNNVHGFRHWYITSLLKGGQDVRTVRKFSRHKSLEMLIVYDDEIELKNRTGDVFKVFSI